MNKVSGSRNYVPFASESLREYMDQVANPQQSSGYSGRANVKNNRYDGYSHADNKNGKYIIGV